MTFSISKDFHFSASHQLGHLPVGHPCARLHGHNYVVRVELSATDLDEQGFVVDFGDLGSFGRWVDANLDHRHLNDVLALPTSERLARWLADVVAELVGVGVSGVGVSETLKTWAWWRP